MAMLTLLRAGGEIGMEFSRDFSVELFEFVGVKTILTAADFVVGQRDWFFVVNFKPLRLRDLFFNLGQFVVSLADGAQERPSKARRLDCRFASSASPS
jgi:hypothetical protein